MIDGRVKAVHEEFEVVQKSTALFDQITVCVNTIIETEVCYIIMKGVIDVDHSEKNIEKKLELIRGHLYKYVNRFLDVLTEEHYKLINDCINDKIKWTCRMLNQIYEGRA